MARPRRRTSRRKTRRAPRRIFRRKTSRRRGRGRIGRRVRRGIGSKWGKISSLIGGLAFVQQVTGDDMHGAQNLPIGDKAKVLISSLTGRIFGFSVVPGMNAPPQTFNFGGIFNKWSGLGAGLILLGKSGLPIPHRGKAATLGNRLLSAGVIGGFFSPGNSAHTVGDSHSIGLQSFQFAGSTQTGV